MRPGLRADRGEIIAGFGTPLVDNVLRLGGSPADLDHLVEVYSGFNERHHDDLVKPFPGAVEVVRTLRGASMKLGIVTGKRRRYALMGLELAELTPFFSVVVTPEMSARPKPFGDPVSKALDLLDASPVSAIFIGDSPHDIASAKASGVRSVAVSWGPCSQEALRAEGPTHWIERWDDVLTLVGVGGAS
ncbi:MAG: HAD hydrolase-like protein [Myxococcales bacterium]|nr:HAD hydrolase-like protein [Myxococcales bacterium]